MLAIHVSNFNSQKYRRLMLAFIISRNAGVKGYQIENPETLAMYVSNHMFSEMLAIDVRNQNVQSCWRQLLAMKIPRIAGNNKYNYNKLVCTTKIIIMILISGAHDNHHHNNHHPCERPKRRFVVPIWMALPHDHIQ